MDIPSGKRHFAIATGSIRAGPAAQPAIGVTIWAAAMVTAVAIWWMRPRALTATEDIRHVDLLGF